MKTSIQSCVAMTDEQGDTIYYWQGEGAPRDVMGNCLECNCNIFQGIHLGTCSFSIMRSGGQSYKEVENVH